MAAIKSVWRVRTERYKGKRVPVMIIEPGGAQSILTRGWTEQTFTEWLADELAMEEESC